MIEWSDGLGIPFAKNFLQNVAVTFGMTLFSIEKYASSACWAWYQFYINKLSGLQKHIR